MTGCASFTPLTHESVLAVRGPDAKAFLQGQITCNLAYVSDERSSLGARCTPKGRMLSSFRILLENDGYLLAMNHDILVSQLAELQKYAVFSKSKLSDDSALWNRFGLYQGDQALTALGIDLPKEINSTVHHNHMIAIRVSELLTELWVSASEGPCLHKRLLNLLPEAPLNTWLLGEIRSGIGHVSPATREQFIPQMLNLPALDAVSFKKGCYTGQEIVARMQYLGKLKRHMYRFQIASTDIPEAGTALMSPVHSSAVGEVVSAARSEYGVELLATALVDAVSDGRIYFENNEKVMLEQLDLPYLLDTEREILR
ncbi:folate-binding protein YgfZ [Pseudomonas sp. C27(2019)]|uniref:CAF17-like 4Fe-4S cluster assembly/insertion protein YgfZ n=1 Tax=Pseudomonas sp. C27(2019) TaxID=2604941 RepID=UPI001248026D|nr:folate-binding protein YgfZ [Pseudomonas sp. C27(2019)]QEY58994.1 folate-binding protein YgfZ [Pseudomonas sp. C27(2019)]